MPSRPISPTSISSLPEVPILETVFERDRPLAVSGGGSCARAMADAFAMAGAFVTYICRTKLAVQHDATERTGHGFSAASINSMLTG